MSNVRAIAKKAVVSHDETELSYFTENEDVPTVWNLWLSTTEGRHVTSFASALRYVTQGPS